MSNRYKFNRKTELKNEIEKKTFCHIENLKNSIK